MPADNAAYLDGLPPELARALRDTPVGALPLDADLERALYILKDVPSNTASAMTLDDWRQAWVEAWQRANRAEVKEAENDRFRAALEQIAASPRPDGTYNLSREACEEIAREALRRGDT